MHSFRQSRGRILFEAFCALAISSSCVGAWTDLGTLAFLPAAAVSALYGLVRLFDLRGRKPAAAVAFANAAVAGDIQGDLLAYVPVAQPEPVVEVWPVTDAEAATELETTQPVEETAPEPKVSKPVAKKSARARRKKPVEAAPVIADPVADAPVLVVAPAAEAGSVNPLEFDAAEESAHPPVTPLFEPEPFVRQQRTVFGRKAG